MEIVPTLKPEWQASRIRAVVLGLIFWNDCIFVSEGYDPVKQEKFYRSLGGGIEFGEHSLDALKREFQEEVQAELTNIQYAGCLENIFHFSGKQYHEIVQLYCCDFVDPRFYQLAPRPFSDGHLSCTAHWMSVSSFQSGELRLYPDGILSYL